MSKYLVLPQWVLTEISLISGELKLRKEYHILHRYSYFRKATNYCSEKSITFFTDILIYGKATKNCCNTLIDC